MAAVPILDVKFNADVTLSSFGIGLMSYKVQSVSSRKNKGIDIPGMDGIYKVKSSYSDKEIEMNVVVEGNTAELVHQKIRTFLSWLSQQSEVTVTFTDNPNVFVHAELDSADDYYVTRGVGNAMTHLSIKLQQYDPFTYDIDKIVFEKLCTPGEQYDIINSGIYVPYVIYLSGTKDVLTQYNATSLGHGSLLSKSGNAICSNILLTINNVQQLYSGTLTETDILEINGRELEVKKNGESVISSWEGDMQDLIYGVNKVSISNTENQKVFLRIEYNRRWV